MSENKIDKFKDSYNFLSNFYYPINILHEGILYTSSEAAYQACKTLDIDERLKISKMNPGDSKEYGGKIKLRKKWDTIKVSKMLEILKIKFENELLREKLINTNDKLLIEGNTWHDNFWGDCSCYKCIHIPGKNNLGILLMKIRGEIII